ncbi:uncharacterized protein LOC129265183 [Lytechinus pictus]|uniref:uncharacterized protein LOC129265183 n=1 Tax=Lytechinus pictus TaxID=7653 RepID=UPI0030BA0BA8
MLFACGLSQRGESHEGIEGFLIKDILAERKRAQKLKCKYCKKKGASVGCSVKACHQIYHYGCGVDEEAIYLFYDSFVSYCAKHRPVQKVLPSSCSPSKGTCPICMEPVETTPSNSVLKTPCCKGTWLHRQCVQMQALSAGYFFRCAICNNENEFQDEMKKFGIYLPEKDADWEFGSSAYQELYERHNQCDVSKCRCPKGRKYSTQSGQWEIVLCDLCGSAGCHVSCGGLLSALDDWACKDCTSTFTRGFMEQNAANEGYDTSKSSSSLGTQQNRTPGQSGTRARSAIRSQGKRPRPPPTTPRPVKKMKQSSTPIIPPLSPVSTQQSSLSSSPKSTPFQTMKFPRVSLSPTYEWGNSGHGSSRELSVTKCRELLPQLDCYVTLEPPSQNINLPNLSMPSLSPAASSSKKSKNSKTSNKLKYKKARKLDLNSCSLAGETGAQESSLLSEKGDILQSASGNMSTQTNVNHYTSNQSSVKLSWGSRILDSVGSFLWRRRSPSKASASSGESQETQASLNDSNGFHNSTQSEKLLDSNALLESSSCLDSPESSSPVPLSKEIKEQIVPVDTENIPVKTKNMLHSLTSWKDDTTWKEAKQDLVQLFQVDGRATRSALKNVEKTPSKSTGEERKASGLSREDNAQQLPLPNKHYDTKNNNGHASSLQKSISPLPLSKEIKEQIVPVDTEGIPVKTKNFLHSLTSWKDDTTWKEAKQDLVQLFQVDGRATRSALKNVGKTPSKSTGEERKASALSTEDNAQKLPLPNKQCDTKNNNGHASSLQKSNSPLPLSKEIKEQIVPVDTEGIPVKTKNLLHSLTSWKDDTTWKEAKQDLVQLFQVEGRATRSALKNVGKTPSKTIGEERKAGGLSREEIAQKLPLSGKSCNAESTLSNEDDADVDQMKIPISHSQEVESQINPSNSTRQKRKKGESLLNDLTSWKDDSTWKEAKQDLSLLSQVDGRATRNGLKKDGSTPAKRKENEINASCPDINHKPIVYPQRISNIQSLASPKVDSHGNSEPARAAVNLSEESETPVVALSIEGLRHVQSNLVKDLTSWKNDTSWKEAKRDLDHLFQIDGRATRSVLKKDGIKLADDTALCSPSPKKQKLTLHSPSPLHQSCHRYRTPKRDSFTGKWKKSKGSTNPKYMVKQKISASDAPAKNSHPISCNKQSNKPQEPDKPTNLTVSAEGSKELHALTSWKDDITWKEAKGDLVSLIQVDGRTTRSVINKDARAKSTPITILDTTGIEMPCDSGLTSSKKSNKLDPKHDEDGACATGNKDSGEAVLDHEAESSVASINEIKETGEMNVNRRGSSSVKRHKRNSLGILTAWKDDQTWKEFRDDMSKLLEEDARMTRNKAQKHGLKGISFSPNKVGKQTISPCIIKDRMPSTKLISAETVLDRCSPKHTRPSIENSSKRSGRQNQALSGLMAGSRNGNSQMEKPTCNDISPHSSKKMEISVTGIDIACNIGTEEACQKGKSRKSLLKIFAIDNDVMSESSRGKSEHGDREFPDKTASGVHRNEKDAQLDVSLLTEEELEDDTKVNESPGKIHKRSNIVLNTGKTSTKSADSKSNLSLQDVGRHVQLIDRSSQTTASINETEAYLASMGQHYREPGNLSSTLIQDGKLRSRYTQTYNVMCVTPNIEPAPSSEGELFNRELAKLPEMSDGKIMPQKNNRQLKNQREFPQLTREKEKGIKKKEKSDRGQTDYITTPQNSAAAEGVMDSGDNQTAFTSSEAESQTGKMCRSLLKEELKKSVQSSKYRRTKTELLKLWTGDDVWKEAKDDVQILLNSEERMSRSTRKEPKPTHSSQSPTLAQGKTDIGSSMDTMGLNLSKDLRKKKYCCSHMRSPWKTTSNNAITHETLIEPDECQEPSPVFGKKSHPAINRKSDGEKAHSISRSDSKQRKSTQDIDFQISPESMNKVWKPRVCSSVKRSKEDGKVDSPLSCSKESTTLRLHLIATSKANNQSQEHTAKNIGRPRKEAESSEIKENMGRQRKQVADVADSDIKESPSKQPSDTSEIKKKIGRPRKEAESEKMQRSSEIKENMGRQRKQVADVADSDIKESPSKQPSDTSEIKKKIGRPRKEAESEKMQRSTEIKEHMGRHRKQVVDVADSDIKESPSKQPSDTSEIKKKMGRPRKEAESEKMQRSTEIKEHMGRHRKQVVDVADSDVKESPSKQPSDTSEIKKKMGRPRKEAESEKMQRSSEIKEHMGRQRKQVADVADSDIKESPSKQPSDTSEIKKKMGRPRKEAESEKMQRSSEIKEHMGRQRKQVADVADSDIKESPSKQPSDTSEIKKKMGRPRKEAESEKMQRSSEIKEHMGRQRKQVADVADSDMKESHSKQPSDTSEIKKKMGWPRKQIMEIAYSGKRESPHKKLVNAFDKSSKTPKKRKMPGEEELLENVVDRSIKKAKRRFESDTTQSTFAKADDLECSVVALQKDVPVREETSTSSTQTYATVKEVEDYVTSKGKVYLEPCFVIPRPSLIKIKATCDMRTQTYNLELSPSLEDEVKPVYPPIEHDKGDAKRPSRTPQKMVEKRCVSKSPSILEKLNPHELSPILSAVPSSTGDFPCAVRAHCLCQTDVPVEEVEAHIQAMGEWYREPSIIVTGSQDGRTEPKNSVRTQTYNMSLPERELPSFKKKWSKRVQNQMKSTQTLATLEEVEAYVEANRHIYTDRNYSSTLSYFVSGSSLTRHMPTQTFSFVLDKESPDRYSTSEKQIRSEDIKGNSEAEQRKGLNATDNTPNSSRQLAKPEIRNSVSNKKQISSLPNQRGNQLQEKPPGADCQVASNGISHRSNKNSLSSGLNTKKQNWFRLKPKK